MTAVLITAWVVAGLLIHRSRIPKQSNAWWLGLAAAGVFGPLWFSMTSNHRTKVALERASASASSPKHEPVGRAADVRPLVGSPSPMT